MSEAANKDLGGASPLGVGERLKSAREAQGLGLETIAERTRVPIRHLQMIESGEHEGLPAIPYSAGFVKVYAQLLGLDGVALARDFRAELGGIRRERDYHAPFEPADPARVPTRALALVGLGVALLLGLAYLFWRGGGMGEESTRIAAETQQSAPTGAVAPPPPVITPQPAPQPLPPAAAAGPVALTANEQVWVKVYDMGGPTFFMGVMEPGQRFEVPATAADPRIQTGRPHVIRVTVGDAAIPPLGTANQTIKDVSLSPASLRERLSAAAPVAPGAAPGVAPAPAPIEPLVPPPGATPAERP
ncbi:XRE family transcriptional regulator [Sphingomonas oleivorans]|uniref:XRE family transcriptional regulator n=1 Tax=Sphingomonas oleivorans TaxID=1735121 RepID=A0A2T5G0U9_9SPHN|nr:helix-turn-helix domain-containing protein [Sphingomonas oleivorans]PTQ12764.1 XRE family transcriptional regulator [Sphingomonas oleivorans]